MPVHKLILGGKKWLPFALSKLRLLGDLAPRIGGYANQTYTMPDGATVNVSVEKVNQFVRITGKPVTYEFFTSGHVDSYLSDPEYLSSPYYVNGSATRVTFGRKTESLFSSQIAPGTPPEWVFRAGSLPMTVTPLAESFKTHDSWQNQKFFSYPTWPNNADANLVTSCQAQAPGWNSMCNWLSAHAASRVGNGGIYAADYGLDVPPVKYTASNYETGGPEPDYPWVYWRHATVQGGFFVSTDNMGRFMVYRVKPYSQEPGIVEAKIPAARYKTYTPPYPAWVTVPDPADYRNQSNNWLWAFNSTGTRAVTCPFNSVAGEYFKHLGIAYGAILPEVVSTLDVDPSAIVACREDTPGLVEFEITITETGVGEMDFNVAFTLVRSDYFPTSGRWIFDAAYTLPDKSANKVPTDTLVTAELQCFTPPGCYEAGPVAAYGQPDLFYVDNYRHREAFLSVNTNDAALTPTEVRRVTLSRNTHARFQNIAGFRNMDVTTGEVQPGIGINFPLIAGGEKFIHCASALNYGVGPPTGAGFGYGWVFSMELRTLSFALYEENQDIGEIKVSVIHYNEVKREITAPLGFSVPKTTSYPEGPATVPVPTTARRVYMDALTFSLNTEFGQGFSVHPAGHWAHSACAEAGKNQPTVWDMLRPFDHPGTTHKTVFNKTFGQNRDYAYYTEPFPYKSVSGDFGSFRTQGLWVTF